MASIYNSARSNLGLKYECKHCPASYSKRGELQSHLDREHSEIRHTCVNCSKTYATKASLKQHRCKPNRSVEDIVGEVVEELHAMVLYQVPEVIVVRIFKVFVLGSQQI